MALLKPMTASNGVPLSYFRISNLHIFTNGHNAIHLNCYISQEERERERAYVEYRRDLASKMAEANRYIPEEDDKYVRVYCEGMYFEHPYDQDMTIESAYEYLKTLPEFEGAEDC